MARAAKVPKRYYAVLDQIFDERNNYYCEVGRMTRIGSNAVTRPRRIVRALNLLSAIERGELIVKEAE